MSKKFKVVNRKTNKQVFKIENLMGKYYDLLHIPGKSNQNIGDKKSNLYIFDCYVLYYETLKSEPIQFELFDLIWPILMYSLVSPTSIKKKKHQDIYAQGTQLFNYYAINEGMFDRILFFNDNYAFIDYDQTIAFPQGIDHKLIIDEGYPYYKYYSFNGDENKDLLNVLLASAEDFKILDLKAMREFTKSFLLEHEFELLVKSCQWDAEREWLQD